MNKHEVARLHLLPMLSRYRRMSESVHHDEQHTSLHCRECFRYDEQRSSLHTEGLICIWILAFPIGIIQVSNPRKWSFLLYFISLRDYWPPTTLIFLVHNTLGEMEWCEIRAFQLLKMWKMKVRWNIKTKYVTDFYWQIVIRVWRIILVITWWAHKRQTFTLISI